MKYPHIDPDEENGGRDQAVAEVERIGEPQSEDRRQHDHSRPHQVHGMHAGVDQKIELLRAVMDGVKAPEERDLVAQAMRPVIGGLAHHHRGAGLEPNRPGGDRSEDAARG